jgi:hypothetical protein
MAKRQQERAELVKWLNLYADGSEAIGLPISAEHHREAARLLEEDGNEIERLHHIRDKARQTGSAPYGWYAAMAEQVDALADRAEKAEAELARVRKERDEALASLAWAMMYGDFNVAIDNPLHATAIDRALKIAALYPAPQGDQT